MSVILFFFRSIFCHFSLSGAQREWIAHRKAITDEKTKRKKRQRECLLCGVKRTLVNNGARLSQDATHTCTIDKDYVMYFLVRPVRWLVIGTFHWQFVSRLHSTVCFGGIFHLVGLRSETSRRRKQKSNTRLVRWNSLLVRLCVHLRVRWDWVCTVEQLLMTITERGRKKWWNERS